MSVAARFRALVAKCTEIVQKGGGPDPDAEELEEERERGQEHVFNFYDQLDEERKKTLDEMFDELDLEEIENAFSDALGENAQQYGGGISILPPNVMYWDCKKPPVCQVGANVTRINNVGERRANLWKSGGLDLYNKARLAVVILSGGSDTPFVPDVPVPILDFGLLSHKTMYQIFCERVRRLEHLCMRKFKQSCFIPIYVMCNTWNRDVIEDFFHQNKFFGIREQEVTFFTQGNMPTCDAKGKFLLSDKHRIAMHPNGNGGLFKALMETGMVADMKSRGVSAFYACGDRNLNVKVGDPLFLGFCEACKVDAGLKTVERLRPENDLGVYCMKATQVMEDVDGDGKFDGLTTRVKAAVIEPNELPEDLLKRRGKTSTGGEPPLVLCNGNISEYYFRLDFSSRAATASAKQWHVKQKSMRHVDTETGKLVVPGEGDLNAYQLQHFIFDAFEITKTVTCLEVPRYELARVKNMTGEDSPLHAVQILGRLHQRWIVDAGGHFDSNTVAGDYDNEKCEVSPLVTFEGEDLQGMFPSRIVLPFYLPSFQETQAQSSSASTTRRSNSMHYLPPDTGIAIQMMQNELEARLALARKVVEDPKLRIYEGERVGKDQDETEVLPPTPKEYTAAVARQGQVGSGAGSSRQDEVEDKVEAKKTDGEGQQIQHLDEGKKRVTSGKGAR